MSETCPVCGLKMSSALMDRDTHCLASARPTEWREHCYRRALDQLRQKLAASQSALAEATAPPTCCGEWLSGSGGHRQYGVCGKPATWVEVDDLGTAFCDEHMPLAQKLAASERETELLRKGYKARGLILAAYRTGGRPSAKALDDASEVARLLEKEGEQGG